MECPSFFPFFACYASIKSTQLTCKILRLDSSSETLVYRSSWRERSSLHCNRFLSPTMRNLTTYFVSTRLEEPMSNRRRKADSLVSQKICIGRLTLEHNLHVG